MPTRRLMDHPVILDGDELGALAILNEIVHVQREYMREGDPQRMWDELLRSLLRTTASRGGFIGEIEWGPRGIPNLNTRAMIWDGDDRGHVPHPDIGLLVSQVIAEQAPVIVDLDRLGRAGRGPAAINGFLGMPLVSSDRLVGIVGLVSGDEAYSGHVAERLQPLLSACASIVESLQAAAERNRLVAELERTAGFLQAVINATTHGTLVIGPDGLIETANPAAHALLDSPPGQLVGRPVTDFVPPGDLPRQQVLLRRALRQGVVRSAEPFVATVVGFLGTVRSVEAAVGEMMLDGERRLVVMLHDITDRLQAQAALARAAEVIDATPDLIAWTDPGCRLVYINEGGRDILGIEHDTQVEGLAIDSFCTDDLRQTLSDAVATAQAQGVWRGELTFQRTDGGTVPVSVVVIGNEGYVAVLARDLTERLEIDRLKEAFVSNVSHELRTPLTAVIGYLELLGDGVLGELTPDQAEVVEIMSRNGDRLLDLIGDILLIGSMDAGNTLSRRPVDMSRLVAGVVADLDAVRERKGITVEVDAGTDCIVVGDQGELKTVVANLVGNALKFTPTGGRVEIVTHRNNREVTFRVTDTGIGISEEELEKVFDRFFRGGHARNSEIQGAGLGLAIVDGVVQRHGGRVDISSAVGVGTTVTVVMDAAEKGAAE